MDPQHHRVFLARFEVGGLHQPALNPEPVLRLKPQLLVVAELHAREHVLIDVDDRLPCRRVVRVGDAERHQLPRTCRRGTHHGRLPGIRDREAGKSPRRVVGQLAQLALHGSEIDRRRSFVTDREEHS